MFNHRQPYLAHDIFEVTSELALLGAVKPAIPRPLFDLVVAWSEDQIQQFELQ